ncbi:hypothetical protein DTO013E5_4111 [Penicillium roqueforti]|uniref:Genomic scaffold, ProqFM164S01 n=1 Tax=Penicillium roqueforti (strain FM164) TaxID=1365484 RepID=W6PVY7_PENRF|nr:uncharacterized protein LCP9604111_1459 [Penicillium roqueforti]CDM27941.1 unnamed protein product [Penicillium roqueforti FM164]KAF9251463.1 hypothetical protein LCP9604111_1459 [Penicillium roqueforti]KAI1836725.1 hypothetical protein CBS147337_2952 [Penicillium roqueforti]KAI2685138.1 hypothetical protein LCP963914a_4465 [Penicillium roqueforti]KAI2695977.1 hypothetical protein CBS147372_8692 [Penicillium roqueforti]
MLFNKSIFAVAIVALANVVTATTVQTPACVLKIIGNQANPADSKTICGSSASKIQSDISKNCADSQASLKFFVNNCALLGHKVVADVSTTTGTSDISTATGTAGGSTATGFVTAVSSVSATKTGASVATGTASNPATGTSAISTGTASESGVVASASPTFNAAASDRHFSATSFVAVVFLGAAALL